MKKQNALILLCAVLIAAFAVAFTPPVAEPPILVETLTSSSNSLTVDTIAASETVYFPITNIISGRYEYAFQITADSLSGGPAGTATLQMQTCWNCDDWVDVGTDVTINGVTSQGSWTGTAYGVDYRVKVVTTATTQSNRVECHSAFKRLPQ